MRWSVLKLLLVILDVKTMPDNVVHLLKATYTCPAANACPASIIAFSKVNPWLLCMVIAQANLNAYAATSNNININMPHAALFKQLKQLRDGLCKIE